MSKLSLLRPALVTSSFLIVAACSGDPDGNDPIGTGSGGGTTGSGSAQGTGGMTSDGTGSGGVGSTGTGSSSNSGGSTGSQGNTGGTSGGTSTGGMGSTGSGGAGDPNVDQNGKENAAKGEMTSENQDYLKLGDIRILNNNWGSEDLNCSNSAFSVFVEQSGAFGWTFDRGSCGGEGSKPDFPQVEFGVHPFGVFEGQGDHHLATSPNFSSTSLMPIQIKDVTSASVNISGLNIALEASEAWNITFEFWVSERNPLTDPDPGVYAELMTFWGWQPGRWPSSPGADGSADGGSGTGDKVSSGSKSYTLWVQRDMWADGWRYYQFRADDGPQMNFSGKVDVKPFIDYLVNNRGFSQDYWITRLEAGSEIDDNTKGKVTVGGITFEVNGQERSQVYAE